MEISDTVTTISLIYVRLEIKARVQVNIMLMKQTRQYIPSTILIGGLSTFTNYPSIVYVMHLKFVSHYKMCIVTSVWTGLP